MWAVIVEIGGEPCVLSSTINITDQKRRETLLVDMAKGLSAETSEAFFCSMVQHLGKAIEADLVIVGEMTADQNVTSLALLQDGLLQPNARYSLSNTPCDITIGQSDLCIYGDGVQALFPQDQFLVDGDFHAYIGLALRDADGTPIGIVNALWRKPQPPSPDRDALVQIFASRATAELMRLRRDREIQRLNETLEQRVTERTEQLQATNAELESFGYSVSHDLQSPLRSIEGFNVLLARRLKNRMSEEEERLFDRVRVNVVRMHELIRDLLALARVSKGKLMLEPVDLSALAQQVVEQLRLSEPQRQVEVTIQPGVSARCDSKFARIILENLIGNAWKYSRGRSNAQIGFGVQSAREDEHKMLFVRDNGAGFNMAYSDSLFKPFHRLHQDEEFEGSGIGLATVHRILERHGGTIRGESTEGAGACFYFSFHPRFSQIAA
jgi:signal transduction histidine kinase